MYYNVIYIYKVNKYKKMILIKKNANIFHIKIIIYLIKIHSIMQMKYYINNTKMHVSKNLKSIFYIFNNQLNKISIHIIIIIILITKHFIKIVLIETRI